MTSLLSWVEKAGVVVEVPGLGPVTVDIVYR